MMTPQDYAALDARGLASAIKRGETTAREAAHCAAALIAEHDHTLNAVTEIYPDRLEAPTSQAGVNALMFGVPTLLKDAGSGEAGRLQSFGSRLAANRKLKRESEFVSRLKTCGLNIIGRTNTPEFTAAATTESLAHGQTHNPWDLTRSPGGSSGGAAVAVAAGYVPLAHGTDTGGSIRIPAACCGVTGFKPSRFWFRPSPVDEASLFGGLNSEFFLTRNVSDAGFAFHALRANVFDEHRTTRPCSSEALQGKRIAVWPGDAVPQLDPEFNLAINTCLVELMRAGAQLSEAGPTIDEGAWIRADGIVWAVSLAALANRLARETGGEISVHTLEPVTLSALEEARSLSSADWMDAMDTMTKVRMDVEVFFDDHEFLISPTIARKAPQLNTLATTGAFTFSEFLERTGEFAPYTALFNVSGHPAISIPVGQTREGLPIGIQIVGRQGKDDDLLALALWLEAEFGLSASPKAFKQPAMQKQHEVTS